MEKRNPWDIDEDVIKKQEQENKGSMTSVFCPKMNVSIGRPCKMCDYLLINVYNKRYPDNHPAKNWAKDKKAKLNIFFNAVFSDARNVPIILNLKNEAGNFILEKSREDWKDILNPYAGKGRELTVKKVQKSGSKGGSYLSYSISPVLEKADWEVPEEVWKNAYNLDQDVLINMIKTNSLTEENYYDVAKLKEGETKKFRLLPSWQNGVNGSNNRKFAQFIWRHWGVTEGQVEGTEPISWSDEVDTDDPLQNYNPNDDIPFGMASEKEPVASKAESSENKKPECFGKEAFFGSEDAICKTCSFFKMCARSITA